MRAGGLVDVQAMRVSLGSPGGVSPGGDPLYVVQGRKSVTTAEPKSEL